MRDTADGLSVTVIVPAHNAEHYLALSLEGLLASGFGPDDVIVFDDASKDATRAVARSFGVRLQFSDQNLGAAGARNAAARLASGDILLFVDADVVVHADVQHHIRRAFEDANTDAVVGAYDDAPARSETFSRLRNLLHHHVHQAAGPLPSFWTGLGAVRRSVFEKLGGFDPEQKMMEDIEFGIRLYHAGHTTILEPRMEGQHLKYWSLWDIIRTDTLHRAVPWTKLLRSPAGRDLPDTLNVSRKGKFSVLAAGLSLLSVGLLPFALAFALVGFGFGLVVIAIANKSFLRFVANHDGLLTLPAALFLLWVHFSCAGLGYAAVRLGIL
ncbi:hypothetical protein SuNHUV7_41120 (plasmid) [Pseudoseohaeicola sp. NH-UV-7]|uniref:glycosyltransferase family 2 protein n=1 Tax=Sulfitobacter sp. TBRI5 TaxID=2989732 RepID=UPI003A654F54